MQDADNLIKAVRGLDQSGSGENGKNLDLVWTHLVASSEKSFHAAEESTLRWLLKSMNGSTAAAEAMRRYPLTWAILHCVFSRIPLFSLAKSLADRKFVAVLQQTLRDISTTNNDSGPHTITKRKRPCQPTFGGEEAKSSLGCLSTAKPLFAALKSLLARLDDAATTTPRDKIGAEHIRSLFCMSAADAAPLLASAFSVCQMLLVSEEYDVADAGEWISVVSAFWNLHMQGLDDTSDFATHLFLTPASMLGTLENFSAKPRISAPVALTAEWSADLQRFLQRNFVLPCRTSFINRQDFSSITRALDVSKAKLQLTAPVLYFLAAKSSDTTAEGERRKNTVEWMQCVFEEIEKAIPPDFSERNRLLERIIRQAIAKSTPVDVKKLREIARKYVLDSEPTDWALLGSITTCDPTVFQASGDGGELLTSICDKIAAQSSKESRDSIVEVLGAIRQSFVIRRDLVGYLQLWFAQLRKAEEKNQMGESLWFEEGSKLHNRELLCNLVEKELSPSQLSDFVSWLESLSTQSSPYSLCTLNNVISAGLKREAYIDAIGLRLFQMTWTAGAESSVLPLRWRISSRTIACAKQEEKTAIWGSLEDKVKNTLKKGTLDCEDTFQCFRFCYDSWDSLSTNDAVAQDLAKLVQSFAGRLAKKLISESAASKVKISDRCNGFEKATAASHYLDVFLSGGSRFNRLFYKASGHIAEPLTNVTKGSELWMKEAASVWQEIFNNDVNLSETKLARALLDQVIEALERSGKKGPWPGGDASLVMQLLSRAPLDSYNRWQREKVMNTLNRHSAYMISSPEKTSLESWKQVMSLATKMMTRATFYDDMTFDRLVKMAETISSCVAKSSCSDEDILEMMERFCQVASATIRQMADQIDERSIKYFLECSDFIVSFSATKYEELSGLHFSLLKSLIAILNRLSKSQNNEVVAKLLIESKEMLAAAVMSVVNPLIADHELLEKRGSGESLQILAAVDAATSSGPLTDFNKGKLAALQTFADKCGEKMAGGDVVAWKMQIMLRNEVPAVLPLLRRPKTFGTLSPLPPRLRSGLLRDFVASLTGQLRVEEKLAYLGELVDALRAGCHTDGQTLAIREAVGQIIGSPEFAAAGAAMSRPDGYDLAAAYSEIVEVLGRRALPSPGAFHLCRTLCSILERKPQAVSQWDVEATLTAICRLCCHSWQAAGAEEEEEEEEEVEEERKKNGEARLPYLWLCRLAEVIIKKHRLRLEGHCHLLVMALQRLLERLVIDESKSTANGETLSSSSSSPSSSVTEETKAHAFARLITLVCEPTAGAVSRTHHHHHQQGLAPLESATDVARRAAGQYMYLVLMRYVTLQLTGDVSRSVREALEPAMYSVLDITPPEARRILNDALDASGRAILRDVHVRYVKFGKWSGV